MQLPLLKTALVCTNFSILSFLSILILEHLKANHNILSWSSAFHILCLCWLVMRGVFWFFTISSDGNWSNVTFYTLYWMPHPFQFGAFMLLPLFFAQVVYPVVWQAYWVYVRPAYILSLFGIIAFQTAWAILATVEDQRLSDTCDDYPVPGTRSDGGLNQAVNTTKSAALEPQDLAECFHTDYSSDVFRLIASFLFVGLAIIQGVYGYQIALLEDRQYARFFNAPKQVLNVVNATLLVSFLSRGLYQFGTVFGLFLLPQIPLQGDEDVSAIVFFCFELWDYIPTVLLVLTVTSRSLGTQRSAPKPSPAHSGQEGLRLLALNNYYGGYGLFSSPQAEAEMSLIHSQEARASGLRTPVDHASLDRFEAPALPPSSSLLGNLGGSFPKNSYTTTGDPELMMMHSGGSPAGDLQLQGPGRQQRRRGNSLTEMTTNVAGGVVGVGGNGWGGPLAPYGAYQLQGGGVGGAGSLANTPASAFDRLAAAQPPTPQGLGQGQGQGQGQAQTQMQTQTQTQTQTQAQAQAQAQAQPQGLLTPLARAPAPPAIQYKPPVLQAPVPIALNRRKM